uniref:Secreted protein n=1 Tax=Chrysotila carterae TaxID=13221 RepID=A0A7S4BX36_CHRCT
MVAVAIAAVAMAVVALGRVNSEELVVAWEAEVVVVMDQAVVEDEGEEVMVLAAAVDDEMVRTRHAKGETTWRFLRTKESTLSPACHSKAESPTTLHTKVLDQDKTTHPSLHVSLLVLLHKARCRATHNHGSRNSLGVH